VPDPAIRAAGGVVWRSLSSDGDDGSIEVALIHRPRYDDWSLPKGKLAGGESEIDGAIREVLEETGFDELRWVDPGEAAELLTRPTDRDLLDRFVRSPAPRRMVLIVRHGSAGSRSTWQGDDGARPLDACGWAQAESFVRFLAHFDPTEIMAADVVRCAQTVEPLAAAMVLPVRQEPILSEAGYPGREDEAVVLLREIGGSKGAAVVCSQGDVIPDLLGRLAAADGVDLPSAPNRKASTWALAFDDRSLVTTEYFPPPEAADCGDGVATEKSAQSPPSPCGSGAHMHR
jgi:8-oxo-dGTP diphosphatase